MRADWTGHVRLADTGGGSYRPQEVLVHEQDVDEANRHLVDRFRRGVEFDRTVASYRRAQIGDLDVLLVVDELRGRRLRAQPNHVLFADTGVFGNPFSGNPFSGNPFSGNPFSGNPFSGNPFSGNPFSGNPFSGNPFSGNPFSGNPFSGNPFSGNPFSGNPFSGNPFSGNPFSGVAYGSPDLLRDRTFATTGRGPNLARPAAPLRNHGPRPTPDGSPHVAVLDVGLPSPGGGRAAVPYLVAHCEAVNPPVAGTGPGDPDLDGDGFLDRIAGHGMFVAGRVAQVHPTCRISVLPVLTNAGDGDEQTVAAALESFVDPDAQTASVDIVNLSFGGYEVRSMGCLRRAVRSLQAARGPASAAGWSVPPDGRPDDHGVVVVASAGNDASPVAPFPAAFPGVVSVGALGPMGPAAFTNWGSWVRACAAGVDVVSTFFDRYDGANPLNPSGDPDRFEGAATWSGTSFAAPFVAGKIAKLVTEQEILPKLAVRRLLDAPGLARIPNLGTVVTE